MESIAIITIWMVVALAQHDDMTQQVITARFQNQIREEAVGECSKFADELMRKLRGERVRIIVPALCTYQRPASWFDE